MTTNLLLLDLDGTVRRCKSDPAGFINSPLDQEIIPEAARALALFKAAGWGCIGVTDQGGVAAGYKTLEACIAEQVETMRLAPQINLVLLCPDMEGQQCVVVGFRDGEQVADTFTVPLLERLNSEVPKAKRLFIRSFRKPSCGMLLLAGRIAGDPDRENCLMVGDREEDREAAISVGMNFLPADAWRAAVKVEAINQEGA